GAEPVRADQPAPARLAPARGPDHQGQGHVRLPRPDRGDRAAASGGGQGAPRGRAARPRRPHDPAVRGRRAPRGAGGGDRRVADVDHGIARGGDAGRARRARRRRQGDRRPAPARLSRPLFAAEDLACARGGRLVLVGVTFALAPGEALVLRGPNGAGKSSLLRVLAGLLAPSAGALFWDGRPALEDRAEHRLRLHLIGHSNAIKGALTVRGYLSFAAAVAGAPATGLADALDGFELAPLADVPAGWLSAGQQRRLALARLLAAPRPLWLLDEPEAGLDAANRVRLARAVAAHRAGGGIAVIATHGEIDVAAPHVLELRA